MFSIVVDGWSMYLRLPSDALIVYAIIGTREEEYFRIPLVYCGMITSYLRETTMTWIEWYDNLAKPCWTPAPSTISLIWTLLYPVIVISFRFVFVQAFRGKVGWKVALPFAINLVANLLFMPIFAGLRNVPLACLDIVIV